MPPTLPVHTLKIGVTQQARAAGKGALAGSRLDTSVSILQAHWQSQ